ncbi:MAG: hypothetical protein QNK19_12410, partial [Xanthomonadales bacterium]|nr:hypothetical protein [Xanthomonadales bacterium]
SESCRIIDEAWVSSFLLFFSCSGCLLFLLTIQDLLNAKGVDGTTVEPLDGNQTNKTKPEKDGGG